MAAYLGRPIVDPSGDVGDAWGDNAAPTADAARLLLNRRIAALQVVRDEKVVGIITETDMIRAAIDLEETSYRSLGRAVYPAAIAWTDQSRTSGLASA